MEGTGKTHSKLYNRGKSGKKLYPRLLNSAFIHGSQSHFCKFVLLSEAKRTSCSRSETRATVPSFPFFSAFRVFRGSSLNL